MTRGFPLVILLVAALAGPAVGLEGQLGEGILPTASMPFDFVPLAPREAAVLEDRAGRVLRLGGGRATPLPGPGSPRALALDEAGTLVVVGREGIGGVRQGREVWRSRLRGDARPREPISAAARQGILWIVDRASPKVFLFAYDGASLGAIDLARWARAPFAVALGPSGEAFLTDPLGPGVLALSPSGAPLGSLDLGGTGVTRPTGIAVDAQARVWVSDGVTGRVVCLDPKGGRSPLSCAGKALTFDDPLRLAWAHGALWVLEARSGRLRRVEVTRP